MKTFIAKSLSPIGLKALEFYQQVLRTYKSQGIDLPCTQKVVELIEKQLARQGFLDTDFHRFKES